MARKDILVLLEGRDRRTIGRSDEVAAMVLEAPNLFRALIEGLWSNDPRVRMRAADATEKVTRLRGDLLQPYKNELLGLLSEAREQELRWHLAVMLPRLELNEKECQAVLASLNKYLQDRSSIVRTFALQGMADLSKNEPSILRGVIEAVREATRTGTPAMKARSRKLLKDLERL